MILLLLFEVVFLLKKLTNKFSLYSFKVSFVQKNENMKKLLLILTSLFLYSCAPTISTTSMQNYSQLNPQDNVIVYREGETLPIDIKIIGRTAIGDSGFTTNCGLDVMIEKAKNEARKIGANAIVITKHILPSVWGSTCHQIKADLVKTGVQTKVFQNIVQTDTIAKNIAPVTYDSRIVKSPINYNKFFLTVNYGFGYRTAGVEKGTPELEKTVQKELGSGNSLLMKAGYRANKSNFYGLVYSRFSSSYNLNSIIFTEPNGFQGEGRLNQTNTINFIGLTSGWNAQGFSPLDTVVFDLSVGYINYSEKRTFFNTYEAKGGNLGISSDLSYYVGITKNFKVGPTFSFSGGALKKYSIEGSNGYRDTFKFDENTFLSLYRVDFMLGTYFEF